MKIGTIIAIAAIVTVVGLVGAVNTWLVSQTAKAPVCQEFFTGNPPVLEGQKCSSDSSHIHANANNNNVHFKHLNH